MVDGDMKSVLAPVGSLADVRRRVEEYEEHVKDGVLEHNSLSRDRAFLLEQLDNALALATSLSAVLQRDCGLSSASDPP